eukprot:scaffold644_cov357-Pavlova_lutheri.AAC.33
MHSIECCAGNCLLIHPLSVLQIVQAEFPLGVANGHVSSGWLNIELYPLVGLVVASIDLVHFLHGEPHVPAENSVLFACRGVEEVPTGRELDLCDSILVTFQQQHGLAGGEIVDCYASIEGSYGHHVTLRPVDVDAGHDSAQALVLRLGIVGAHHRVFPSRTFHVEGGHARDASTVEMASIRAERHRIGGKQLVVLIVHTICAGELGFVGVPEVDRHTSRCRCEAFGFRSESCRLGSPFPIVCVSCFAHDGVWFPRKGVFLVLVQPILAPFAGHQQAFSIRRPLHATCECFSLVLVPFARTWRFLPSSRTRSIAHPNTSIEPRGIVASGSIDPSSRFERKDEREGRSGRSLSKGIRGWNEAQVPLPSTPSSSRKSLGCHRYPMIEFIDTFGPRSRSGVGVGCPGQSPTEKASPLPLEGKPIRPCSRRSGVSAWPSAPWTIRDRPARPF